MRPNPTALPFNQQIASQRRNLLHDRLDYNTDYRQQVSDVNRSAQNQIRALDLQQPEANRNLLNSFAGRGMAYSTGYGYDYGQQANQFATARSNIGGDRQLQLARMLADKNRMMNEYQYQLGNLNQRAANLAESQAGNLGYYRPKTKKKKAKKRH